MKNLNRKIRSALFLLIISLMAFIGFSKVGILFSSNNKNIITVSTTKKTFDPNNYVASMSAIMKEKEEANKKTSLKGSWTGVVLSKSKGAIYGPSGKETYYNLNMSSVVNAMRRAGYSEGDYPYWIREDGVKMLGQYVMVAADYNTRPRGTILESSLGLAIVCDTGGFAKRNPTQLDIAVTWK